MKTKHKIILALFAGGLQTALLIVFSGFTPHNIKRAIAQGVLFGLVFGFVFPFLMQKWAKWVERKIVMDLDEDEELIYEGGANLFRGIEGVGGKLFLTNQRLYFKPHKINVQSEEQSIPLAQIDEVSTYKTSKIIQLDNGLQVDTVDKQVYKFVVNDRDEWIEQLISSGALEG